MAQDEAVCIFQNSSYLARCDQHVFTLHPHSSLSFGTTYLVHAREINPCHDPQQVSVGCLADVPPTTGYEPKDLAENDDLCVKPSFFHRPSVTSTSDSAESIATLLLNRISMMSKFVLFTTVLTGERSKCGPITSLSLCKRSSVSSSSQVPKSAGKSRCVVFEQKEVESSNIFRQRRIVLRTSSGSRKQRTSIQIL